MTPELGRRLGPARQVWEAQRLAERWSLTGALGYQQAGTGLDDNESARLQLPGKEELLDYVRRVFSAADRAVGAVDGRSLR